MATIEPIPMLIAGCGSADVLKTINAIHRDAGREVYDILAALDVDPAKVEKHWHGIPAPDDLRRPEIRFAVHTPSDLIMVRRIWERASKGREAVPLQEAVAIWDNDPQIQEVLQSRDFMYFWK